MDDEDAGQKRPDPELECRPPLQADVAALCRELNRIGARYVVVGGFAIVAAGFPRTTADIDLVVAADSENERKVFSALSTLPDNAVRELQPGELQQYNVIRVADEFVIDLMVRAGGIDYAEAAKDVVVRELDGVAIPFASPRLLWRMKAVTHRAKDDNDLVFLRHWFAERGQEPPRDWGPTNGFPLNRTKRSRLALRSAPDRIPIRLLMSTGLRLKFTSERTRLCSSKKWNKWAARVTKSQTRWWTLEREGLLARSES